MLEFTKGKTWIKMRFFKKFECERCNEKFSQQEDLMHHQEIVHSNSAYDCKECNEFFSSMEDMRTHLKKNHSYRKDN